MPSISGPVVPEETKNGNESASTTSEQKGDILSMFYLPSSRSYDEDVAMSTTPFSAPSLSGAASAVMGGVWSVLDAALAVLNEEFDNPSDSMISESTKNDEDGLHESGVTCERSKRSGAIRCCRQTARSKLSPSAIGATARSSAIDDKSSSSGNLDQVKHGENAHNMSVEQSDSQEKDYYTPQNSLIGSISTLQLYDEGTAGETTNTTISDQLLKAINAVETERKAGSSVGKDHAIPAHGICKNEEPDCINSEYYMVRNESETNDGWLVVGDD